MSGIQWLFWMRFSRLLQTRGVLKIAKISKCSQTRIFLLFVMNVCKHPQAVCEVCYLQTELLEKQFEIEGFHKIICISAKQNPIAFVQRETSAEAMCCSMEQSAIARQTNKTNKQTKPIRGRDLWLQKEKNDQLPQTQNRCWRQS